MQQLWMTVRDNRRIARDVFRMELEGGGLEECRPGQFISLKLEDLFLRRPISIFDQEGDRLRIIYKVVGRGTEELSAMGPGKQLDVLTGLGNGYDLEKAGESPLLLGGGVGVPPLHYLARKLRERGKTVTAVLGFNTREEVFGEAEFRALGCETIVATADGSLGRKGFVTDVMPERYSYYYTCGPEPMLKAVYRTAKGSGQFSLEERMGCGFGACMGCTCQTAGGPKRICREGPVLEKEELLWDA